jgi:pseudaminic acid synthase
MNDVQGGIQIAGRPIGRDHRPFVIAEMSGNHNQSLERALDIVDAAASAGAHALKIQTYTADTMTLDIADGAFRIDDPNSLWAGKTLHELYDKAHTPWEWHEPIFARCRERGMVGFSTPFDASAVDFLESCGAPCYKIASFENTDIPLLRKVAATGKPVIMSTGMASIAELDDAVGAAREAGCRDLVLLKCTSTYPATPECSNVRTIPHLRELFGCEVGLSDHTHGVGAAVAAIALGATVVEKHFTLSRADGGVDSAFSMEPAEMALLVTESGRAWQSLGAVRYGVSEVEQASLSYRRSLYVVRDVRAGEIFSDENVRAVRPGFGLPPKNIDRFIGQPARRDLKRGEPLAWDMLG